MPSHERLMSRVGRVLSIGRPKYNTIGYLSIEQTGRVTNSAPLPGCRFPRPARYTSAAIAFTYYRAEPVPEPLPEPESADPLDEPLPAEPLAEPLAEPVPIGPLGTVAPFEPGRLT